MSWWRSRWLRSLWCRSLRSSDSPNDDSTGAGSAPGGHEIEADRESHEAQSATEPFVLEITDVLDLHTFAPRDIGTVVEAYLEEARAKGFTTVRIIHGKGIGVQRERVRAILRRTPFVAGIEEAPEGAGSWGATVAWFQPAPGGQARSEPRSDAEATS